MLGRWRGRVCLLPEFNGRWLVKQEVVGAEALML